MTWMPGDWMSVSMTPTRLPARATSTARLAVVFDLPVPPRKEWVEMIFAKRKSPGGKRGSNKLLTSKFYSYRHAYLAKS